MVKQSQPKKSFSKSIKTSFRKAKKANKSLTLKQFVREAAETEMVEKEKVDAWLFNKGANFSKSPLGLGSTRKKKNK